MGCIRKNTLMCPMVWLFACLLGCDEPVGRASASSSPEQVLPWGNLGKGWGPWGASGDCMYAASVEPSVAEVWQWEGDTMKKRCSVPYDDTVLQMAVLSNEKCICYVYHEGKNPPPQFHFIDLKSGKEAGNWDIIDHHAADFGRASQNGKHLALWSEVVSDVRFGLMAPDGKAYDWKMNIALPPGLHTSPFIRPISSNDGHYITVAGLMGGVTMVDLVAQKIIWLASFEYRDKKYEKSPEETWKMLPFEEINSVDAAFTPDSKLVYSGGASGCVYGMKVETGEIVSKWWATPSEKQINGYQITTVAVSPDGRYVAAGTGSAGHVYLFSTKDGKRTIFNHGGSTILMISFSPDSKRLASYASGQIKIWKLPEMLAEITSEKTPTEQQ